MTERQTKFRRRDVNGRVAAEVDRLILMTMAAASPKAQISGGKPAAASQRVEDNAFHLDAAFKLARVRRWSELQQSSL